MPVQVSYPGVYIEEIPSGVRTITGVSTSVTAFVGYTKRGPIQKAEEILSPADFERKFGGLAKDSPLSYAVQHFFMNGGQQAYVVRLTQGASEAAVSLMNAGMSRTVVLVVTAREPGASANGVTIRIDYDTAHPDSTFNLRVEDAETGGAEEFLGVTMNSKSRRNVDNVINRTSQLIEVKTDAGALGQVAGQGESRSGRGISSTAVDATHRQFMITLDEEDGPQLVTIYDGSPGNRPGSLVDLASRISTAVKAIDPGVAYHDFACHQEDNNTLILTSGEKGDGSFVRVTSAGALDVARLLKLGVANGGKEIDAAAKIRPAPVGTTSGDLESLPTFSSDRTVLVTIDGDGPNEVTVFRNGQDDPPDDVKALGRLLREKLRKVKPKQAGSTAFMGIETEAVGNAIQILSGAEDNNSLVQFENLRVLKSLTSISFLDVSNGWAVGEEGTILNTTDGGTTWSVQASDVTVPLHEVFFRSDTLGWAVGGEGTILNTTDGGTNWLVQDPPTGLTANLSGVFFRSDTLGWAVGGEGTILNTTDGGTAWSPQTSGVTVPLYATHFRINTDGLVVGDIGTILKTTDGGTTWTPQNSEVTARLNDMRFLDATHGWAVGEGGTILHWDGTSWSEQQAVTDESAEDDLKLTASTGSQNVKAYTLGLGKTLGAQSGATPGQDGSRPEAADYQGSEAGKTGIHALLDVDLFNILSLPDVSDFESNDAIAVLSTAVPFCEQRRAFCIIDSPKSWRTFEDALDHLSEFDSLRSENAAMYFPHVEMPDPLDDNRLRTFPPCGILAGIYARTDAVRGFWKAPAGQETLLNGVRSLAYKLSDRENGLLNPLGLNCLRTFPVIGSVSWGARTLQGADVLASEWKYIPVRRVALYLEESLYRGLKWVVFEPNDEPLWAQIRLNVGAFMHNLFRQGAFQGMTPREAYFVKCDKETTTQNDINLGIVNVLVGFAPLKPAEFVIIKIQQIAGQIEG
jgi:phage tail sheath protein FI/photosystem II stability/assembly factor-like uncharacterized protein